MYSYRAFGLHIDSELELPELEPRDSGTADVTVVAGPVNDAPRFDEGLQRDIVLRGSEVFVYWSFLGTIQISGGHTVVVSPNEHAADATVRMAILGVGIGILLHQRGLCTLHASALSIDGGGAAAFVGWKGAGKSTMAATLQRRGHALLTDDVLALDSDSWTVRPAFPQIKLRAEAAQAVGLSPDTLDPLGPDVDKYALRDTLTFATRLLPLRAIFVLDTGNARCEQLAERDAFPTLLSQTYAPRFLGSEGTGPEVLEWCSALARDIPVFHLCRPRDLSRLEDGAVCVEETMRALPESAISTA